MRTCWIAHSCLLIHRKSGQMFHQRSFRSLSEVLKRLDRNQRAIGLLCALSGYRSGYLSTVAYQALNGKKSAGGALFCQPLLGRMVAAQTLCRQCLLGLLKRIKKAVLMLSERPKTKINLKLSDFLLLLTSQTGAMKNPGASALASLRLQSVLQPNDLRRCECLCHHA